MTYLKIEKCELKSKNIHLLQVIHVAQRFCQENHTNFKLHTHNAKFLEVR